MTRYSACLAFCLLIPTAAYRFAVPKTAENDVPVPEMIGKGIISTPDDELGGTIAADGKTIYFEKSAPPHYLYILYQAQRVGDTWSTPTVLPFSGQYRDTDPVLSPDGNTMLFASDRPVDGVDRHHFYIWSAKKTPSGWSSPELLKGPVNDGFDQVFCSIAGNGNLYFTSSRKGGFYDIYRSRLVDGQYQTAEELSDFNSQNIDSFEATIAPDESFLLLGSFGREPSYGSSDLYISYNQNGVWTKPKNLGPGINTPARDYSPRISGDGKWLIFTSERLEKSPSYPLNYDEFVKLSRGLYNGLGNLYRVPMEYVLQSTKPQ
jgi:Tol biopolymer transport system component